MRFLYLYVEEYRSLMNVEFNLDSNERFHYDGRRLLYNRSEIVKEGFFCIEDGKSAVESVSAIIGENGAGKTSFATLLNYIFVLGRPYPRYICVCRLENNYIAFSNLINTPDDSQVKDILEDHWDFRSKTMHRDSEGCPFPVLYYSPFLHTQFVWDERNHWCHDISASGTLNASVGMVMNDYFCKNDHRDVNRKKVPDSPIECMDQNLNIARIEFLHKYSALPDEERKDIPFPLSLSMEIKPNLNLFLEFEGYLHKLGESNKGSESIEQNIKDLRRLYNYYSTEDPFRSLLISFTICMAQLFEYEKLGPGKCPDVRDLIDMCVADLSREDVVRAIKNGWEYGGRRIDANHWERVDKNVLIELLGVWGILYEKRIGKTMGSGIRVPLQSIDLKTAIMRLLHLHGKLSLGRLSFIAFDPSAMSSGECSYLNMFALLYDRIHATISPIKGHLLLVIDEAETTLHPKWQRELVYNIIWFCEKFAKECSVHVIFMTHSPMLLSDIPIGNCVFLSSIDGVTHVEDVTSDNKEGLFANTFGANIFDMYYNPFFMKDGTIGKFASHKISNALKNKRAEDAYIAQIVGDPFLRGMLLDEFGEEAQFSNNTSSQEIVYAPHIEYPKE